MREGPEELRLELVERRGPVVSAGADTAAEVVDRVVAAPQDPVVGGQPEVVELVVRVDRPWRRSQPIDARCSGVSGSDTRT